MDLSKMTIIEYITYIAKSLINLITMIFKTPYKAIREPEHLFALGHVIVLLGLLMPSWG